MVLHEKGIDFEVHEVDLSNKSEEFLSVSPYGKVPVLRVNGTSLYESNIVNEYLDEVHESSRLMPKDPEGRASARSWMAFADDYFFPQSSWSAWVPSGGTPKGRFKRPKGSWTMRSRAWSANWRAGGTSSGSTRWLTSPTRAPSTA